MSQALFLLVSSLFAFALAQVPTSPTLNDNIKKCNETHAPPTDLSERLEKSGELPLDVPESIKCYIKCVAESEGLLNENGTYDLEKSIAIIKEGLKLTDQEIERSRNFIAECNKIGSDYNGDEKCMTTYLTARCIQSNLLLLRPKPN